MTSKSGSSKILKQINLDDVLKAIEDLDHGAETDFGPSTFYDLVHNGRHYPPKAVAGLAARRILGEPLHHSRFSGGINTTCFKVLKALGFQIVPKTPEPTADEDELNNYVLHLRKEPPPGTPEGNESPQTVEQSRNAFKRDPMVKAWVLNEAEGICELCDQASPFVGMDGFPYLEVHHVVTLADGGPDTISNAAALCPNCHRLCHYSVDREVAVESLYRLVERLKR